MCKTGFIQKNKGSLWTLQNNKWRMYRMSLWKWLSQNILWFQKKKKIFYLISEDGTYHHCSSLGFTNCKNCGNDNAWISWDNEEEGGIEGCEECKNVNNEPKCITWYQGLILLQNNNTFLKISSNVELKELTNCDLALLNNNNHFECKRCESGIVFLDDNNNISRIYSDLN